MRPGVSSMRTSWSWSPIRHLEALQFHGEKWMLQVVGPYGSSDLGHLAVLSDISGIFSGACLELV